MIILPEFKTYTTIIQSAQILAFFLPHICRGVDNGLNSITDLSTLNRPLLKEEITSFIIDKYDPNPDIIDITINRNQKQKQKQK